MLLRLALFIILAVFIARALWRLLDGIVEGATRTSRTGGARRDGSSDSRAVPMVRDPVCGTFVVPERAVAVLDGATRLYFCSDACRDKYRARTA